MTTLPTTTVRVPRSAPPAVLSVPPGTGLGPVAQPAQQTGMTANDIMRVLRANVWLILGFLMVAGIAGFGMYRYLLKKYPRYTSIAYMRVDPPRVLDPTRMQEDPISVDQIGILSKTQAQFLTSSSLWGQVLQNIRSEVQQTSWIGQFRRPNGTGRARPRPPTVPSSSTACAAAWKRSSASGRTKSAS
jgi:hypothetical protein